jgi:hypothetical protein
MNNVNLYDNIVIKIDMLLNRWIAAYLTIIIICLTNYIASLVVRKFCKNDKTNLYRLISLLALIGSVLWLIFAFIWHLYW